MIAVAKLGSIGRRLRLALAVIAVITGLGALGAAGGIDGQFSSTVSVESNEFSAAEDFG